MSTSRSRTQSEQHSTTNVQNLNLQDTQGVTLANSSHNTINVTDQGAVDAARDFANSALDVGVEALRMGQTNLDTAARFAGRGLDTALDATRGALDFSESAVRSNESIARDSIKRISDFGGVALGESLDFARDIFEGAGNALKNVTEQNLTGLTGLAKQTSESSDDKVTRTAMYAFAAIAAVFVLPALFGGARR